MTFSCNISAMHFKKKQKNNNLTFGDVCIQYISCNKMLLPPAIGQQECTELKQRKHSLELQYWHTSATATQRIYLYSLHMY